jgi:hypothetical protein
VILEETDKRVYIAPSTLPGAGKGLFAKVAFAKGESLEVIGVLVPSKSITDRCTYYADTYKFRAGRYLLIPTGYGGIANHSSLPNMKKVVKGLRVYLRALRRIDKDEELLYIYSRYAQKQFMPCEIATSVKIAPVRIIEQ